MSFLTPEEWVEYETVINDFHDDAFQEDIHWLTLVNKVNPFGEDGDEKVQDVPLKGLISYNYFRSWPMNKGTTTGEIDKESCMMYLNNQYLSDNGYLNANGQFKFNPGLDRFAIRGITYKATGDAQISQANGKPLLHFVILKREEIPTGNSVY